jgi:uncharacterized protein YcbX
VSESARTILGSVVSIWRYPVKSMMGEELNAAALTERGLAGDRAYALIDSADGKVASAKNPRKWPRLFDFRAAYVDPPGDRGQPAAVRITLPDGTIVSSEQADRDQVLSRTLQRPVTLASATGRQPERGGPLAASAAPQEAEEYWPDLDGLDHRDTVTAFALPDGTFFDAAAIHLLTTGTLDRLRELNPRGRFEARRFRPNLVVATADGARGFPENDWVGRIIRIGDQVRLSISGACPRCVMTTLAQGDLPPDLSVLRTAAQHNQANVGVYAAVLQGGTIRRGDPVTLEQ